MCAVKDSVRKPSALLFVALSAIVMMAFVGCPGSSPNGGGGADGVTITPGELTVAEGGTNTYTVVLNTAPNANATVTPASDNTDVTFSPATLTFTSANWNEAQTVTVSGAEDDDAINDTATISHKATGYTIRGAASVAVTVTDNDREGVTLMPTSLSVGEESSATYTVRLKTEPAGDAIIIPAVSGDSDVTVSPATLTFTSANWNTAQTVTVRAAADSDTDNDMAMIRHTATGYTISGTATVNITVADNDSAGVTITPTTLTIAEGGMGSYTVVLNTQPSASATITPSSTNTDVTFSPATLTFTSATWSRAQTVTVSGAEDNTDDTDDTATISHTATGYTVASIPSVAVTVTDNDDLTAPMIAASAPANGATSIPRSGTFNVNFNEAISINSGTITIVPSSGTTVSLDVTGSAITISAGVIVLIAHRTTLAANTMYTWTIPADAFRDAAGNGNAETVITFTTGS